MSFGMWRRVDRWIVTNIGRKLFCLPFYGEATSSFRKRELEAYYSHPTFYTPTFVAILFSSTLPQESEWLLFIRFSNPGIFYRPTLTSRQTNDANSLSLLSENLMHSKLSSRCSLITKEQHLQKY
jgi:hypothetical protein